MRTAKKIVNHFYKQEPQLIKNCYEWKLHRYSWSAKKIMKHHQPRDSMRLMIYQEKLQKLLCKYIEYIDARNLGNNIKRLIKSLARNAKRYADSQNVAQ